jgi:hypothetical protein
MPPDIGLFPRVPSLVMPRKAVVPDFDEGRHGWTLQINDLSASRRMDYGNQHPVAFHRILRIGDHIEISHSLSFGLSAAHPTSHSCTLDR